MATSTAASINVMLAIHAKKTSGVELYRPIRKYIAEHFSERDAKDSEDDLLAVQQMRSDMEKGADTLEVRRDLLQRYYRALCTIESRFPISSDREHINNVSFPWYDAFKPSRKASQQNIHFEKAGVVFNLGALYSQIGLAADRSTAAGLKTACGNFQSAAGAFAFLRDNIALKASGGSNSSSTTTDISIECTGMLERLMLAQAQECFYEKVVADGKPALLCSRVARQVAMFYEEALAALQLPPLNAHFDKNWTGHIQLKTAQYQAESIYQACVDLHEKENIAEEIARLKVATQIVSDVRKSCKGIAGPLMDCVTKLESSITRNLERAVKENDRVYLMRVPHPDSLPPIAPASLVSPTPQDETLDASKENLFMTLVPDSSAKALSKYSEMVDTLIREQTEKLQLATDSMRTRLRDMRLPDSLQALEGAAGLPEGMQDEVAAVQVEGGVSGLHSEMLRVKDLRRVSEELLIQAEESLDKEAQEDAQMRSQLGTRWTRPQSATLAKSLRDRATGFAGNLRQAADSDARIERCIKDNEELMTILDVKPIQNALPKLTKPIVSVHGNEDEIVSKLKKLLNEMEKVGSQRAGLEDMLKDLKQKDNILPKLMNCSGMYDDLFKKEIAKYDDICTQISQNIDSQELLFNQISHLNDAFSSIFNLKEYEVEKEKVINQILSAVAKYREIKSNVDEGLKFYVTLQDAITNLKQQCGDFVMTRGIQCKEMMEDLQRQLAGLNFNPPRHGSSPEPAPGSQQNPGGGIFSFFHRGKSPNPPPGTAPTASAESQPPPPYYMPVPPPGSQPVTQQIRGQPPPQGGYYPQRGYPPGSGYAPPTGGHPHTVGQLGDGQPGQWGAYAQHGNYPPGGYQPPPSGGYYR